MNKRFLAHLSLFTANLIYGINYTVAKDVMPDFIQPLGFIFIRVSGAGLLFWFFYRFLFYEKIDVKDIFKLAMCGLFGVAINQMLFFEGLNLTTPINAAAIMVTNPIIVLIIGVLLSAEQITKRKLLGVLSGALGAFSLITYGGLVDVNTDHLWGNIMVLLNATSYGIYLVLVKPLMKKYKPITVISWVFMLGFLFVFPFGWIEFRAINWLVIPSNILWSICFVVLGTTFMAYLLNIYSLKILNPSTVSSYIYLQPVLASIIALIVGSDQINFIKVAATLTIFLGVYLVSVPQKKPIS